MKREFRKIEAKILTSDLSIKPVLRSGKTPYSAFSAIRKIEINKARKNKKAIRLMHIARNKAFRKDFLDMKRTQRYYKRVLSQEGKDIDKTISFLNSIKVN
jgi:hypothetical protein